MEIPVNELAEAKRQIDSILHKLRETIRTLEAKAGGGEKYRSQITLARRRVAALEIAVGVVEREMAAGASGEAVADVGGPAGAVADYGKGMALSDIRHQ